MKKKWGGGVGGEENRRQSMKAFYSSVLRVKCGRK